MNNKLKINQTLHGYSNGHTLLASSINLPTDIKRLMLPISDMSGSSMIKGFESYLTGYSIKEYNCYALAKTWYAPEMKRPGCVWTHTLLIDFEDIPQITNVEVLQSLFVRPVEMSDYKYYESPLDYSVHNFKSKLFHPNISALLVSNIIYKLYNEPNKKLFIQAYPDNNFDEIFLLVWKQQWPRLRRSFSFCTGAISPRYFAGELLDLQIIPPNLDIVAKDSAILNLQELDHYENIQWLQLAYDQLYERNRQLHDFYSFFGSDLSNGRKDFKELTETYVFFKDHQPKLQHCIDFIASHYPKRQEATNIKLALFGKLKTPFNELLPSYDERSIIFYFSITEHYKSFDYAKLDYENRFQQYFAPFNPKSIGLLQELLDYDLNPFGESAFTNLAYTREIAENTLIWDNKNLSLLFISLNLNLSYLKEIWLSNVNDQAEIIHILQQSKSIIQWDRIISLLIEINSRIDPKLFRDDELIVHLVLDWINKKNSPDLGNNWLGCLMDNDQACLEWLANQNKVAEVSLELLVRVLNPNSKLVISYDATPWLNFLQVHQGNYDKIKMSIDFYCFLAALAFNLHSEKAQQLFEISLEHIYFAVSNQQLNYNLWHILEVHTKPLSVFKNWDKGKKLINAVVDQYIKNSWNIKSLTNHITNDNLAEKLKSQYKKRK